MLRDVDHRGDDEDEDEEVDRPLDDVLVLAEPSRVPAQVAQQMVGAQQPERAGDPQEGEVLDEERQQQRDDHDQVGRRGNAEQVPTSILLSIEARRKVQDQHEGDRQVEGDHPPVRAGDRRQQKHADGDDVEDDEPVAKAARPRVVPEVERLQSLAEARRLSCSAPSASCGFNACLCRCARSPRSRPGSRVPRARSPRPGSRPGSRR